MEIKPGLEIPDSEISYSFSRSGGPGGQNVNKTNSKVTLRWAFWQNQTLGLGVINRLKKNFARFLNDADEFVIQSQTYRDQPRNKDDCQKRLRRMILTCLKPPKKRKKTRIPRAQKEKRRTDKKHQSEKKRLRKV